MSSYACIKNFGPDSETTANPLATCAVSTLDSGFNTTLGSNGVVGPESGQCQLFMASYCGAPNGWDPVCEYLSQDQSQFLPNTMSSCNTPGGSCMGPGTGNALTKGQILIRNSFAERYLLSMSGNCQRDYEPFDPTVANSPMIGRWRPMTSGCGSTGNCEGPNACIPIYGVSNPHEIDSDPLMNKVLDQPWIALDVLVNMYNNANRLGTLQQLKGTRLYNFFGNREFQNIVKSGMYA